MIRVEFTPNLEKHLACPTLEVTGACLREVLEECCQLNPKLRGYILDDQKRIRKHVAVFIDGTLISDKIRQTDRVRENSIVFVAQALSGG